MGSSGADRWYLTKEQLSASPSRKHGLDPEKELAYRQQAANLIQDMGQRLQVSQLCINTAIVYMHRFYAFHSFTQFHRNATAAAALFLAAKVEEQPRKLEHVIKIAHMCLHRNDGQPPLDVTSKLYQEQAQDLVFNENVLLQTLGFDVAIDHPHTHVVKACNLIKASKDLAQTSYFMASNSLHLTTMCLQYRPTVVACFCIHLASKWSNWAIPQSSEGKHWFFYVDNTVTGELLDHLTSEFLHIFDRCPARLKKKLMSISNVQGTNSPQQANSSHPNGGSNVPSSPFDKEPKKITADELEKLEYDKRQLGLFVPSGSSSSLSVPTINKMDYREYKERQQQQQQQQDRRRPPNMPSSSMQRPPEIPGGVSQSRQSSSSSGGQRLPQNIPSSQHRWPSNQRSKDPNQPGQSMRVHPSQPSSRPHHRSSSSVIPPQLSQSLPQSVDQRSSQSRSQSSSQQSLPPPHSSRAHPQPQLPPQQLVQQQQQQQAIPPQLQTSQQPLPVVHQQPSQQPPVQRPPSLFSPEPQRKQSLPRRPPVVIPSTRELPTLLSPFSSSPPQPSLSQTQSQLDIEQNMIKKEIPRLESQLHPMLVPPEIVEMDPSSVSSLLKESLPHRAEKKKKKDKHKHKDRDKREEKKKHKKDKDKRRDNESSANTLVSVTSPILPTPSALSPHRSSHPLKITIAKDVYSAPVPQSTGLKIKIPKERLKTEPMTTTMKIKIPKEYMDGSRKRPYDLAMPPDMLPHKAPRLSQHPHEHKTIDNAVIGNGQGGGYK